MVAREPHRRLRAYTNRGRRSSQRDWRAVCGRPVREASPSRGRRALPAERRACSSCSSALYALWRRDAAPGAAAWYTLVVGEIYVLARHFLKLTFYASETVALPGAARACVVYCGAAARVARIARRGDRSPTRAAIGHDASRLPQRAHPHRRRRGRQHRDPASHPDAGRLHAASRARTIRARPSRCTSSTGRI